MFAVGYWASYNVPFYRDIYNISGNLAVEDILGDEYSYDLNSRAKIFRRDVGKVIDMKSLQEFITYNGKYVVNPYIHQNPFTTIKQILKSHHTSNLSLPCEILVFKISTDSSHS